MDAVLATPDYQSNTVRPLKDTLILAVAFLCVFSPFQAIQNLQSSLNQQQGLGVTSLACVYGTMFVVSFITPALVYNLGIKTTILAGWLGHTLYVACNFYPSWMTLVPGSIVLGLISCPLWTSTETYMSSLARKSVELDLSTNSKRKTTLHAAFSRLNGVFSSVFSASQFIGNLVSSVILFQSSYDNQETKQPAYPCGAEYCPMEGEGQHIAHPEPKIVYILLAVFLVCDVAGLALTARFLPKIAQPQYTGREIGRKLRSYWAAFRQPKVWLLVPLFASRGLIFTLYTGLFTESYVSCSLGIRMVGYVMAVWGLATMLSSALLGYVARFTGRQFLCGFAYLVDLAVLVAMLLWRPTAGHLAVDLCLAVLMGLVDGIWIVQINALIAVLFPAIVDSAFAVRGTWQSLTVASSWMMASYLCPLTRIYTAIGLLSAGLVGYVVVEILHRRSLRSFDRDDHEYVLLFSRDQQEDDELRENDTTEETVFDTRVERKLVVRARGRESGIGGVVNNGERVVKAQGASGKTEEEIETLLEAEVETRAGGEDGGSIGGAAVYSLRQRTDAAPKEDEETDEKFFDAEAEARGRRLANGDAR